MKKLIAIVLLGLAGCEPNISSDVNVNNKTRITNVTNSNVTQQVNEEEKQ